MEITETSRYYGNINLVDAYENKKLLLFCNHGDIWYGTKIDRLLQILFCYNYEQLFCVSRGKEHCWHNNTLYNNRKIIYINFYEYFEVIYKYQTVPFDGYILSLSLWKQNDENENNALTTHYKRTYIWDTFLRIFKLFNKIKNNWE